MHPMGRVKEFDRDVVLERAMNFFWKYGYRGASMNDLLDAMVIGRQSLYDTFGDKHSLFLASLQRYYDMGMQNVISRLRRPDGGMAAIEEYFKNTCEHMCDGRGRSCLMINSANELAPDDPDVATIVNRFIENLQKAFAEALRVAVKKGEVRVDSVDKAAWNLTNSAMGFGPMGKARISRKVLNTVTNGILDTIRV
jgi:TetR/AcrR family transcriptional repressor of nem operon